MQLKTFKINFSTWGIINIHKLKNYYEDKHFEKLA